MEPEAGWQFWQRLLRQDALLASLRMVAEGASVADHFSPTDRELAAYYAGHFKGTELCVTTFRFRMASAFGHCMQSSAPLTYRALVQAGVDMKHAGQAFQEWNEWQDYGPRVNAGCAAAIAFLRQWAHTPRVAGLSSLLDLEQGAVELARRLSTANSSVWARQASEEQVVARATLTPTGTAALVTSEHALTDWLRDRAALGVKPLARAPESYLLYFARPTERLKLLRLSEMGARVYRAEADDPEWCKEFRRLGVLAKVALS
jgi:hypothetical protein